jgi:thiopurine S-methyltransferase
MDIDFWQARWNEGRIGFHEGRANAFLEKHVERLGKKRRVLVPLCGKAEDMAFLAARGHEVVGIEAVEDAVRAFFVEHALEPEIKSGKLVRSYSAGGVTILAGDVFACTREELAALGITAARDALYDRAALVALPPDVRPRYVEHLRALLAPGASGLVITFEYDQERFEPPPFAVTENEVRELFAGATVEAIDQGPGEGPRFRAAGVQVKEQCFAITL